MRNYKGVYVNWIFDSTAHCIFTHFWGCCMLVHVHHFEVYVLLYNRGRWYQTPCIYKSVTKSSFNWNYSAFHSSSFQYSALHSYHQWKPLVVISGDRSPFHYIQKVKSNQQRHSHKYKELFQFHPS